jgi:hypothetical protein
MRAVSAKSLARANQGNGMATLQSHQEAARAAAEKAAKGFLGLTEGGVKVAGKKVTAAELPEPARRALEFYDGTLVMDRMAYQLSSRADAAYLILGLDTESGIGGIEVYSRQGEHWGALLIPGNGPPAWTDIADVRRQIPGAPAAAKPRPVAEAARAVRPVSQIVIPFRQGSVVRVRYRGLGGGALNLCCGENIVLHVNPRPDEKVLVVNSFLDGRWWPEERRDGYPFDESAPVSLMVWACPSGYYIQASTPAMTQPFF